nr:PREDICTED: uncharacterized protein LOC105679016 [Linepithema humile]
MSKFVLTKDNVWDYFEEIPNKDLASCKKCGERFVYTIDSSILKHLRGQKHQKYFNDAAKRNVSDNLDIYYTPQDTACTICKIHVLRKNLDQHIKDFHPLKKLAHYEAMRTKMEHIRKVSNFKLMCELQNCNSGITLQIHPNINRHLQEKHPNELKNIETDATPTAVTNKEDVLRNYILHRPHRFQAQCKFCNFNEYYVQTENFRKHVQEDHNVVLLHENAKKGYPWKHFKYFEENILQCNLCQGLHIENVIQDKLAKHVFKIHRDIHNKTFMHRNGTDWTQKYCDFSDDFQVRCYFCNKETELDIEFTKLNDHIVNTHSKEPPSTKRQYETAGPSGSQPQKKKSSS